MPVTIMPIYEYEAQNPKQACKACQRPFEILQGLEEPPLTKCPQCGQGVRKVISWCRAAVMERSDEGARVETRIREYEKKGMWSHAAELADKYSEKSKDSEMKMRAIDNYEKAGYGPETLEKHAETKKD